MFFDGALDDAEALAGIDHRLREIASFGAMIRRAHLAAAEELTFLDTDVGRARAVIAAGPGSRLLRAVVDAVCPVPFVAWPHGGLPTWAGPLDLVVMISPHGAGADEIAAATEARRRGCAFVVATPRPSPLDDAVSGRGVTVLPSGETEPLAQVVPVLEALHLLGLGPKADAEDVATVLDQVATQCGPAVRTDDNVAKRLALALADDVPVVWGGSVLAARAARRIVEAWRTATGRPVVAGDVEQILPILLAAPARDVFADPFEDEDTSARPTLVLLDDGADLPSGSTGRSTLENAAEMTGVRTQDIVADEGPGIARFAALVTIGQFTRIDGGYQTAPAGGSRFLIAKQAVGHGAPGNRATRFSSP